MRATFLYGARDIRVQDVPAPTIRAATDAIVRVVRACVCGSDLHRWRGLGPQEVGRPMGHEFIGVVEQIGSRVTTVGPGDFVISTFAIQDNTCEMCRAGMQTSCDRVQFFGTGDMGGTQAELVRIPLADGTLVKTGIALEDTDEAMQNSLLTLSDVYITGYHGAFMGKVRPGACVVVIGDGAVGLSAVLASKQLGAEQVILMGRHADRLAVGAEFGATEFVSERGEEGVAKVVALTGGRGAHIVIEAVGHRPAYEQAYGVVRAGGTIARIGVPQYDEAPIGWGSLFGKNVTLTGGPSPVRAYIEAALRDVLAGTINPGLVFDRTVGLDAIAEAYRAMDSREALKVAVTP